MERAVTLDTWNEVLTGCLVPAGDVPAPAAERVQPPPQPGAWPLLWQHHGPFITPFLPIPAVWADGAAAHAVSPLAVQLLLAIVPSAIAGWIRLRSTRKGARAYVVVSRVASLAWILATGLLAGTAPWMDAVLLAGGWLLAGTRAHETARRRREALLDALEHGAGAQAQREFAGSWGPR